MDTKQRDQIDVTDPQVQQACAAIMAAVLRRDPAELREMWRLVATAAACHWAGGSSGAGLADGTAATRKPRTLLRLADLNL